MKLNYRDKVILGILLAVVILIGGFVGLVKPKSQDIETDQAELDTKQTERDEVQGKLDQIEPLTKRFRIHTVKQTPLHRISLRWTK